MSVIPKKIKSHHFIKAYKTTHDSLYLLSVDVTNTIIPAFLLFQRRYCVHSQTKVTKRSNQPSELPSNESPTIGYPKVQLYTFLSKVPTRCPST